MKELIDLERNDCRFPFGDGPFLFCAEVQKLGSSYCAEHHAECFRPEHWSQGSVAPIQTICAIKKSYQPAVLVLRDASV